MEVSGVVYRQVPSFYGAGIDTHSSSKPLIPGVTVAARAHRNSVRPKRFTAAVNSGFSDNGHLEYYASPRCGGGGKKEKKDETLGGLATKKNLKLLEGLSSRLSSSFPELGFSMDLHEGLAAGAKNKLISV